MEMEKHIITLGNWLQGFQTSSRRKAKLWHESITENKIPNCTGGQSGSAGGTTMLLPKGW